MTDAQKTYDHWGMTREEILDYAENDLRRLRKKEKESMGFPQDGSSGQYDAWTEALVTAMRDHDSD